MRLVCKRSEKSLAALIMCNVSNNCVHHGRGHLIPPQSPAELTLWGPPSKMLIVYGVTGPLDPLLSLPLPQLDGQAAALLQHDKTLRVTRHSTVSPVPNSRATYRCLDFKSPYCLNAPLTILRLNVRKYIHHNFLLFLWNHLSVSRMLTKTTWERQFGMFWYWKPEVICMCTFKT